MEGRHPINDNRNSIKPRRASRKNQERRRRLVANSAEKQLKLMAREPKVVMTNRCRFCPMKFKQSRAFCPYCLCCQFCGLVPTGNRQCEFCDNKDLDKKKMPRKRRVVRGSESSQKPQKKPKRISKRIRPQKRMRVTIVDESEQQ